jgi:hypothetical protein
MIKIHDDEQWEPDRSFAVELFCPNSYLPLPNKDTRCEILILDDDQPGFLSFGGEGKKSKVSIKHIATEDKCHIKVHRSKGSDGKISVRYRTLEVPVPSGKMAQPGHDYEAKEGLLEFGH